MPKITWLLLGFAKIDNCIEKRYKVQKAIQED